MNRDANTTDLVRRHYDKAAAGYDRQITFFERILFGDGRRWVCSQASGDVLEIAAGTGRNLRYYPEEVKVTGIELSPSMLELARQETTSRATRSITSRRRDLRSRPRCASSGASSSGQ